MTKSDFPASLIRDLFTYEDGLLSWRMRPQSLFRTKRACSVWNARFARKLAGHVHVSRSGTRRKTIITILGTSERHLSSRLIWTWHHGEWPSGLIDHEDGDTLNDSIGNLRDVTSAGNSKNMRMHPGNTSGVTGVCWHKKLGKWKAEIMANRVKKHLGVFDNIEDAAAARKAAERMLGFHPNHGRASHV
ncbi:HNH endonuclease [Rhizobium leguminosarum]|uniref:HNH endonuclease n=1 Tax=Rhizobium leguminosarum TaxID=384 RepID=UPI0006849A63|nr:HNH endonuclease [Rhizobium leguminosarum]